MSRISWQRRENLLCQLSGRDRKLSKASWTSLNKKNWETGSSDSSKRVRSPTPLEYASDHPVPSSSKDPQGSLMSHEGSPNYSKWVSSNYFRKMVEWLANVCHRGIFFAFFGHFSTLSILISYFFPTYLMHFLL